MSLLAPRFTAGALLLLSAGTIAHAQVSPVPPIIAGVLPLGAATVKAGALDVGTGAVTAGSATLSGAIDAASAALTGSLTAGSASLSGNLQAGTLAIGSNVSLGTAVGPGAGGGTVSITTPNGSNIEVNPQGTGTITLNATTTVQNGMMVYGLGGTLSGPLTPALLSEYGPTGTVTGNNAVNLILSPSDNVDASGAAGGVLDLLDVQQYSGGSAMKGGRVTAAGNFDLTAPSGNVADGAIYTAGGFTANANVNDNGTSGTPSGALAGLNSVASLGGSATYWSGVASYEADIGIASGGSALDKIGAHVVQLATDAVHGTRDDMGLALDNQGGAVGWTDGLSFGRSGGAFPVTAAGTLIYGEAAGGAGFTVANGVDWHLGTFTGNSWNDGHFAMTGGGQLVMSKITDPNTAPGAGKAQFTLEPGTTSGTCKLVVRAGTSATPVTIADNIGAGC